MQRRTRLAAIAGTAVALLASAASVPAQAQESEVVTLLQQLIRTNTSNPPGNEAQVAELLRARLAPLGFQVDDHPDADPRQGALRRAPARHAPATEKPLLLAGHADVVGVEEELWTVDPFGGAGPGRADLRPRGDGLQGRAGRASPSPPSGSRARTRRATRDLILLSEADEEGGAYGTTWLAENHWDKIDAGVSINEGGWIFRGGAGGAKLMGITTIDKNSLSVTFRTRGTSTHSSRPLRDSALRRLARALNRVEHYDTAPRITPVGTDLPAHVGEGLDRQDRAAARDAAAHAPPGGAAAGRRQAARRPLRRAVRRPRPQHLRADHRQRRLPGERAARARPRRR